DVLQDGVGTIVNRGTITTGSSVYSSQRIDPDVFVNEGTITQPLNARGELLIGKSGGSWTNTATGTVALTGRTLTFAGTGTNLGSISVANSPLVMTGDWSNDGTIDVRDTTLILDGQYSVDDIGTV